MLTRRRFVLAAGLAFSGLAACSRAPLKMRSQMKISKGLGPLQADPRGVLDLPNGFSYQVISKLGDRMSDGLAVPDRADGMGCFTLDAERVALVRNHELHPKHLKAQPSAVQTHTTPMAYDSLANGIALPGGTSTLTYNLKTQKLETAHMSLVGTIRNCSGGVTPWGSWLSCEESVAKAGDELKQDHGYIFEVPATSTRAIKPQPLKDMGRFNHEAAAVDPATGIVYLTEDRGDSLFYRFIPNEYGKLHLGGKLQALVIKSARGFDTRNWQSASMQLQHWHQVDWVDINNPHSPQDDLRQQGYEKGAALFARGEGIHWGEGELYFCCTNGGARQLGQIMRYQPPPHEGKSQETHSPGRIQLFLESTDPDFYNFGDNLTVTPFGDLLICEDQYTDEVNNHLRGVTPEGEVYDFARLHLQTELAGACFSPDGSTLFVNLYSPAQTLAITGPWPNT